jgi:hypothetical protein
MWIADWYETPQQSCAAFHALSSLAACAACNKANRMRKSFDEKNVVAVDMMCVCFIEDK